MVDIAKQKIPKASFLVGDFMSINKIDNQFFDGIWCNRVFHHIPAENQKVFIRKIFLHLKVGGIMFISARVSQTEDGEQSWVGDMFPEFTPPGKQAETIILRKNVSEKAFKALVKDVGLEILEFSYWKGNKWMDILAKKSCRRFAANFHYWG